MKRYRHHGEVIELYPDQGLAAIRFKSGRVECVRRLGSFVPDFFIGQTGWIEYVKTPSGFDEWSFNPHKKQEKKQ